MADDVTPSEVKARRFDASRRGYDRSQVDAYLLSLADDIERLQGKLEDRKMKELKVGLDDPQALALELESIGGEVASILEAARAAADGMRKRAAADVDEWQTTTERATRSLTSDAAEQSQSMRAAAWNEGSSMLSSSTAEAKVLVDEAKEDALFIRAEAEREAIRLTGDAKRDREELIRATRMESEELIESARGESNGMLAAANQQAEQAQERARALEDRRAELLSELESTRASISHLEEEIDSRRQELEVPEPVLEPEPDPRSHHSTDSGSVRIVAPSKSVKLKPVDAEDLVADVVALRSGKPVEPHPSVPVQSESAAPAISASVETETVAVIAPPAATLDVQDAPEDEEPESGDREQPVESGSDDIGSLFASLRVEATEESEPEVTNQASAEASQLAEEPDTRAVVEPDPVAEEGPVDASDDLDATVIPLQNAALKEIKRALVDLQNDALEHLRTDDEWTPDAAFVGGFEDPFSDLAEALSGSRDDGGAATEFSADLHAAVSGAITKARDSGAGDRQVASSVSST